LIYKETLYSPQLRGSNQELRESIWKGENIRLKKNREELKIYRIGIGKFSKTGK